VASDDFKGMHRLGALANDAMDVLTDGQTIKDSNTKFTDWRNTVNIRHCGG